MIGFRLDMGSAKAGFFDRAAVDNGLNRAIKARLSRLGAFVRQRARTSIRKGSGSSIPGNPPTGHGDELLKRFIYFSYDAGPESVVIGPIKLNRPGRAPQLLEEGGEITVSVPGKAPRTLHYRAFPYMGPALEKETQLMDPLWRDSVRS